MSTRKLIPRSVAEQMTRGSLEQTISRVREAVKTSKLFGENVGAPHLVATFPGYALVGTDEGKFFRVKFENTQSSGAVSLSEAESYPVQIFDESNMGKLIDQKADAVVESLMRGEKPSMRALSEMAELVSFDTVSPREQAKRIVATMENSERPWRKMFKENRSKIRQFIESDLADIRARLPKQTNKFAPLYSGATKAESAEYAPLAQSCLRARSERMEQIATQVGDVYSKFATQESKFRTPEGAATIESVRRFAEDFIEEAANLSEALDELSKSEGSVSDLGMACDAVLARMEDFEMAAAFINKTLKRAQAA